MVAEEIARQLDSILEAYNKKIAEYKAREENQEEKESFLASFERVKVSVIKPAMEEMGKYLESKGQQYRIKDESTLFEGNPRITLEILPHTPASDYDVYETPSISFIGDKISLTVGIQKKNGMPGQSAGNIKTENAGLEEVTTELVQGEIIELVKENFR